MFLYSLTKTTYLLHICDTYVSVMYLWVYMIDIAFM